MDLCSESPTRLRLQIQITTSPEKHKLAALTFSDYLRQLELEHCFIGGFAMAQLGSQRATQINVLVKVSFEDLVSLRETLAKEDNFALFGFKLYFTSDDSFSADHDHNTRQGYHPSGAQDSGIRRLFQRKDNVLIETLATGRLGLPKKLERTLILDGLAILHPSILILTKVGRWSSSFNSTRPKTRLKADSDAEDIRYIIRWLADKNCTILFNEYDGRPRDRLIREIRMFWDFCITLGDDDIILLLGQVLEEPELHMIRKDQQQEGNLVEYLQQNPESMLPPFD